MNLSPLPIQKFFGNNGRPLAGGLLFTYAAGTSDKIATYTDASGNSQNTNPIVLDFRGECRIWLDPKQSYKFVLSPPGDTDPPTRPIWTVDDITVAPQAFDNAADDIGTVNNISLIIPQVSSPIAFTRIVFKAANTNTGSTTLQVNGGTAHDVTLQSGQPLSGGEITGGGIYEAIFDGANWQLQSQLKFPRTDAEIAAGVTPTNYAFLHYGPVYNILRYGAVGDGSTDDSGAIQDAVDAASQTGGTVYFPPGYKWGIGSQVTISSAFPVNLIGEMTANPNATSSASYIKPLNNITGSMFKYVSPTGSVSGGGAGIIRGLSFLDDSDRTYTMTAALDLDSFAAGIVQDCSFHKLLGSAILFGFTVQSRFSNIHIRYCGATSQAAMLARSSGSYQLQGNTFVNVISEVNYLAPHLELATNSNDNKFIGMTFESNETEDEEFNFITLKGLRNIVVAPTLNRRPADGYAIEFATGASRCSVVNPSIAVGDGRAILFTGDRNEVRGGFITAETSSNDPVVFVGVRNRLVGVHFYVTRSFDINSAANEVSDCVFDSPVETSGYFLTVTSSGSQSKVCGNRAVSFPPGLSGISIGSSGVYSGNVLSGGGGGSVGISVGSSNAVVTDNWIANFTTSIDPTTHLSDSVIEDNFGYVRRKQGAQASVADGGTITHGLSGTPTTVQLTCSVSGEFASVASISSTTITVAIKKHDGSAGTTQTIYWSASL